MPAGRGDPVCSACHGAGVRHEGGFGPLRVESPCPPCKGTGIAPPWQAKAVIAGRIYVRNRRERKGLGIFAAAELSGVSAQVLQAIEKGEIPISDWPEPIRRMAPEQWREDDGAAAAS